MIDKLILWLKTTITAILELKKRGIKAAFGLTGKKSPSQPLYTIKRIMVPGTWSEKYLLKEMTRAFKQ